MQAEGSLISSWSSFDCSRSESGGGGVRAWSHGLIEAYCA